MQKKKDADVKTTKLVKPSDNNVRNPIPKGTIEHPATEKDMAWLQDVRNRGNGFHGFRPHKVNGAVPVEPQTNKVIPDKDGSVGIALFDPKRTTKVKVDKLFKDGMV